MTDAPKDDDVGILFPDVELDVRDPDTGETVRLVVREFRLLDGLKAQAQARGLIGAISEAAAAAGGEPEASGAAALDEAIGAHADEWLALLARATERDPEWLARLKDADGQELAAAMWEANGPFFVRRVVSAVAHGRRTGKLLRSLASSATSSRTDMDATSATSRDGSPGGRSNSPGDTPTNAGETSPDTSSP